MEEPIRTTNLENEALREKLEALYNDMVEGAMQIFTQELDRRVEEARVDELRQLFDYIKENGGLCENDAYLIADRMQSRKAALNNHSKGKEQQMDTLQQDGANDSATIGI